MYKINTFLQKRKMHESRHGIFMVSLAYALSIMMLFLGSDAFYNIKSTAAGISNEADEVTEKRIMEGALRDEIAELRAKKLQEYYRNSLMQDSSEDTVWLFGSEDANANILLVKDTSLNDTNVSEKNEDHTSEEASGTIQSLSIETSANVSEESVKATVSEKGKEKKDSKKDSKSKSEKKDKAKETSSKHGYNATAEEIEMLERIVQAEAGSEDIKGRILVANVVLNRVQNKHFPDTIEDVIFQNSNGEYQFSPVSDKRFWSVKVSKKTKEAVKRALEGEDYSEGALYFMARKRARTSSARWFDNNLTWLFKHGGHEFYK